MFNYTNRPISPHLSIYQPQMSSLLSIWHRISGSLLTFYLLNLIIISKLSFNLILLDHLDIILVSFKWVYVFSYIMLYYHIYNGIRNIFLTFNCITYKKSYKIMRVVFLIFICIVFTNSVKI